MLPYFNNFVKRAHCATNEEADSETEKNRGWPEPAECRVFSLAEKAALRYRYRMPDMSWLKNGDRAELELLFDITRTFDKHIELRTALGPVLSLIELQTGLMRGMVTLINRATGVLKIEEAQGLTIEEKARGVYRFGEGLVGRVFETGAPICVPDLSREPRFLNRAKNRSREDLKGMCYCCVPLHSGEVVIGTLSAEWRLAESDDTQQRMTSVRLLLEKIAGIIADSAKLRERIFEEQIRLHRKQETEGHAENGAGRVAPGSAIVGTSRSLREMYAMLVQVAPSDATVLIGGESGTGKELIAAEICRLSKRAEGPFLKLNCAALPESIIESELFGHEKGAFTGALNLRKGRFELADKGTIFLDEIADLPFPAQAKLLRVLQEREIERLGGAQTIKVNVRLIAASNKNLEAQTRAGLFREDLFYRLQVFPLHIPPLRERKSDIMLLADYFTEKYAQKNDKLIKRISQPAIDLLTAYSWPGNVRELENCIERAVILSKDMVIHAYDLPPSLQSASSTHTELTTTLDFALSQLEKELIEEALKLSGGNMAAAARNLGISDRQMGLRVQRYGIKWQSFRTPPAASVMRH